MSETSRVDVTDHILLEGVRVHNLKGVDLQIRRQSLTVICGVSGSGKSSLAFDTLFAEGQRRYVETFSPYARQFLDQVERPQADRIEGIPPAIAIRQNARGQSRRSTIGTRTEIFDYLRSLYAEVGIVTCPDCDQALLKLNTDQLADRILKQCGGRAMLVFECSGNKENRDHLLQSGFVRTIVNQTVESLESAAENSDWLVIADRLQMDRCEPDRLTESLEQALEFADGRCFVLAEESQGTTASDAVTIDQKQWQRFLVTLAPMCGRCQRTFDQTSPETLNHQSPLGACSVCEGSGQVSGMTFDRIVPDPTLTLQEGAIAPWTTPAYRHELEELLALAPYHGLPVNVPFEELGEHHRQLIYDGVPEEHFGGVVGFHRWLVRKRYKQGVSVFLNRWRTWMTCPECDGNRLSDRGGSVRFADLTLSQAGELEIADVSQRLLAAIAQQPTAQQDALAGVIDQLRRRLTFLCDAGLGYLSLGRSMKTLSGGEAQRVVLTSALGSGLVNTLYVLDEPTAGLHSGDTHRVIRAARQLQQAGNTVVVVEHDLDFIQAADEVIEIGPKAGEEGGKVVFQGTPSDLNSKTDSLTARAMSKEFFPAQEQRKLNQWLDVSAVNCHNIRDLDVRIPLGALTVVTGVSGAGKSSLVVETLYPHLCRLLKQPTEPTEGLIAGIQGAESLSEVCLLDQSPPARSRRSIPATVVGCFDDVRKVMAETHEAKKRNYKAGMFSFNSASGGRCSECDGRGIVTVEMQFLPDIETTCESCLGRRYRTDVLEVRYRDRSIADILEMTVESGFRFFHGQNRIQQRLNALRQAGLGYVRIGQPVSTLSGGECQRLKIAALLAGVPLSENSGPSTARKVQQRENPTLFILDEPTTGLHAVDIVSLLKCLNHLIDIGHSVVVIEHHSLVVRAADYVIELGPGPGAAGGRIVRAQNSQ